MGQKHIHQIHNSQQLLPLEKQEEEKDVAGEKNFTRGVVILHVCLCVCTEVNMAKCQ